MEFLPKKIDQFTVNFTEKEPELLYELNRQTNLKILNPRMLAGHFQGRVLSMLSKMIQPNSILEIGTYTAYSALCWAEGLQQNGTIISIDINDEITEFAQKFIDKSDYKANISLRLGNALDIIPTIETQWDIVYIDADKTNYANYYDLAFDKVKKGGYIIADNVLWSGKVVEEPSTHDADTKALIDYCEKIKNDKRVTQVLFPIRDGLLIARKE